MISAEEARRRVSESRKALSPQALATLSEQALARLLETAPIRGLQSGAVVAAYRPLPGEPALFPGLATKLSSARFCFPRISDPKFKQMSMRIGAPTERGAYGLLEPPLSAPEARDIALILVPGMAFGEAGQRIGRGEGYYDRFLAKEGEALRIGVAFEFQIFEGLEVQSWDQPMDWVVTERRAIFAGRGK